jgi:hypothetical protein
VTQVPPPYPRIPHLVPGRGTDDDRVLTSRQAGDLLLRPALVEEKLDGANVMLWSRDGTVDCSLRSGPGGRDRAGQIGPLKAWIGERYVELQGLLAPGSVLYAEWLLVRHTIAYDRLPAYLVGLDMVVAGRFIDVDERDRRFGQAGIAGPPPLFRGVPGSMEALEALMGRSAYGDEPVEGVVVRPLTGGEPRAAKLLRRGFRTISDDDWRRGRPRNRLAAGAAWR